MGIKAGLGYDFSIMYRQTKLGVKLLLELINEKNEVIGNGAVIPSASGGSWEKQVLTLMRQLKKQNSE